MADTGLLDLRADTSGSVIAIEVGRGQCVRPGELLLLLESMKMEVPLHAPADGEVAEVLAAVGEAVQQGQVLLRLRPAKAGEATDLRPARPAQDDARATPPDATPRADLARVLARRQLLDDAARPQAVARRHATGLRTARENVADLLDAGSFVEYGGYAVAAQHSRRSPEDLQRHTPADGLVCGTGLVEGRPVGVPASTV